MTHILSNDAYSAQRGTVNHCSAAIYDRCKIVEQRKQDMHEELKARLLAWTKTSSRFGLDSIGKDIANALEAIEQLERQLAERDEEIAKYRDAPVVASASVSNRTSIYGPTINFDYGEALRMAVPPSGKPLALIVKPGEQ